MTDSTVSSKNKNFPLNKQGLLRFSKASRYRMCGVWKLKQQQKDCKKQDKPKVKRKSKYTTIEKPIKGSMNGGVRKLQRPRAPKNYALVKKMKSRKARAVQAIQPIKKSLSKPGTICILLTGPHAGSRVVFIRQLERSGQILVTGPHRYNGCPLKRVYASYVIATSTYIKLDDLKLPANLNDDYFKVSSDDKSKKTKKQDDDIFKSDDKVKTKKAVRELTEERKQMQKMVDDQIVAAIKLTKNASIMKRYLKSKFTITNRVYPHRLKF
ncbi:hypothetical protein GJ496_000692 [Pomphorhynchus laevis]|nr:hypothetical protein GJ496_000692 [Pomphorhynchus laevis]